MVWRMRHGADAHLHQIALMAERRVLIEDLLDHLLRGADRKVRAKMQSGLELRGAWSAASRARGRCGHLRGVAREELVGGSLRRLRHIAVSVEADRQLICGVAGLFRGFAEQIEDERNRSGMPPMMASAMGSPSVPARIAEGGLPPTATQIGILFGVRG